MITIKFFASLKAIAKMEEKIIEVFRNIKENDWEYLTISIKSRVFSKSSFVFNLFLLMTTQAYIINF